eukprot:3618769-Rhodomonas_salina.3
MHAHQTRLVAARPSKSLSGYTMRRRAQSRCPRVTAVQRSSCTRSAGRRARRCEVNVRRSGLWRISDRPRTQVGIIHAFGNVFCV